MSRWSKLGSVPPRALAETRLALHWAAQIPAALGKLYLPPEPDYGHLSLAWSAERRALVSPLIPRHPPFQAGLGVRDARLLLFTGGVQDAPSLALAGRRLPEAIAWLRDAIRAATAGSTDERLSLQENELPEHPFGAGEPFPALDPRPAEELERWFEDGDVLLQRVRADHPRSSPVRLWPHHFDLDTLLAFEPRAKGQDAPAIGVGLSPGDEVIPEPYFYLTVSPEPEAADLPPWKGPGGWHTEGWIGAVLPGTELCATKEQEASAAGFVRHGIAGLRETLGIAR